MSTPEEMNARVQDLLAMGASIRAGKEARQLLARAGQPKRQGDIRRFFASARRRVTGVVTAGFPGW